MNLQRREEIRVIAECLNDMHWAQEMRRAVAELLAHIATLEQAAAERVIADGAARALPQPNDATLASLAACGSTEGSVRATLSWARRMLARTDGPTPDYTGEGSAWVPPTPVTGAALVEVRSWIHAVGPVGAIVWVDPQEVLKVAGIPADRVLGEGMAEELRLLRELEKRTRAIKDNPTIREKIILDKLDALRANQGGAAT